MGKFWIDYSTSVLIEAKNAEEAEQLFWDDNYDMLGCAEISIDGIEEEEDD